MTVPIRRARPLSACAARRVIHLYSTKTVEAHNALNHYLRHEAGFDPKVREVAILTVAREMDSRFEWAAHEPEALKVGVAPDVVDAIKYRKSTASLSDIDAAIVEFGRQAVGKHTVDAAAYRAAESIVSRQNSSSISFC